MTASVLLVAATALHAGFQLVVTLVVYPALAATPAERWPSTHAAHVHRIVPVVGLVYGSVLVAVCSRSGRRRGCAVGGGRGVHGGGRVTASWPRRRTDGSAGRLDERVLRRLVAADRVRLAAAVTAAVAALVAALR